MFLAAAVYIEGWVAEQPLLPPDMFRIPYMRPFVLALVFVYSAIGIFILYATLYCTEILHVGSLQLVAWYLPLCIFGCFLATIGGLILHRVTPTILTLLTALTILTNSTLFIVAPAGAVNYWAYIFPAMLTVTLAVDVIFSVANIFFSTVLPARQQGVAGAFSNALIQFSIALGLGVADVVVTYTEHQGRRQSYKNAFWLELGCGAAALVVFAGFVRIRRAGSEATADEKAAGRERVGVGVGEV